MLVKKHEENLREAGRAVRPFCGCDTFEREREGKLSGSILAMQFLVSSVNLMGLIKPKSLLRRVTHLPRSDLH